MTGNAGTGQDQGTLRSWEQDALEAINFGWGDAYLIGHDDERGYWAARRDRIGGLLTAADADELRRAIYEDYALKPVPREGLPGSRPDGREPILGTDPCALMTNTAEP
jgi:hypothetical protein